MQFRTFTGGCGPSGNDTDRRVGVGRHDAGIQHMRVGKNGDPRGDHRGFDQVVRSGVGEARDVAILKLCYVDFDESTDVNKVFAAYRDTMAKLAADYPRDQVRRRQRAVDDRSWAGGEDQGCPWQGGQRRPERNVVRERFNALIRAEYMRPGALFDIAAIESTTSDGERVAGYEATASSTTPWPRNMPRTQGT